LAAALVVGAILLMYPIEHIKNGFTTLVWMVNIMPYKVSIFK